MSVMTAKQLTQSIRGIKAARLKLQDKVQEALISATFYAAKDGNVEPFNQILDAVGNATHVKGITMWVELNAPAIVREGKFTLNKTAKKEYAVENEDDFVQYEDELRAGVKWYEIAGKQKVESVFLPDSYLGKVADKFEKEGYADLARELRAVKGRFEMDLIEKIEATQIEE